MRRAGKVYDAEHADIDFVPKDGGDGGDACMLVMRYASSRTTYEK